MNIISFIIIISLINTFASIDINYSKYKMKIYGLRFLVFKKKNAPKILKALKNFYDKCYDRSMVSLAEGMNDYNNNFTEEEKLIIETLISLCY
jgi:flagellar motor component MotA